MRQLPEKMKPHLQHIEVCTVSYDHDNSFDYLGLACFLHAGQTSCFVPRPRLQAAEQVLTLSRKHAHQCNNSSCPVVISEFDPSPIEERSSYFDETAERLVTARSEGRGTKLLVYELKCIIKDCEEHYPISKVKTAVPIKREDDQYY